jgi:hypothetical protein
LRRDLFGYCFRLQGDTGVEMLPMALDRSYGILGAGPNSYQLLVKIWVPDSDASALGLRRLPEVLFAGADGSALAGAFLSNDGLVPKNAAGSPTDTWTLGTFRIP